MLLHYGPFIFIQLSGLVQYCLRDSQFAHIVHKGRVFQADGVDLAAQVGRKVPIENHRKVLDRQAVAIQIGITRIDYTDENLCDVNASSPGCLHEVVEQRDDNGDKDAAEEQDQGEKKIRAGENADIQIAQKEEDDQYQGKQHPSFVALAPRREDIMG